MASNRVRIISGMWKSRMVDFVDDNDLRPTPDRLRETLFNWLMWDIQDRHVLDLCAGSGILAFEALSRGAKSAVLIEPNSAQVKYLKQNCINLKAAHCQIIDKYAEQAIAGLKQSFDLVFLDPPYSANIWQPLATLITSKLNPNALIYVEANRSLAQLGLPANWQQIKQTKIGKIHAALYQTPP